MDLANSKIRQGYDRMENVKIRNVSENLNIQKKNLEMNLKI